MSEDILLGGVITALVTPMTPSGAVDWPTLEQLVEQQIAAGVDGLVPVGTTGESPTLEMDEHLDVIARTVAVAAGRVPVIAGTGANSTAEALHLTTEADRLGADAFLQVAPYYNKPSQEGLYQHFSKIAQVTRKPIVLYSVPGRCGVEIATSTVARLAADHTNIRYIKEAGGSAEKAAAMLSRCPEVTVLCGDDGLIAPFVAAGAVGVVSVAANFAPEVIRDYLKACLDNQPNEAARLYQQYEPLLTDLVFMDGNPVTIKEVMFQTGKIPSAALRLPLVRMSEVNQQRVRGLLQQLGFLS